MDGIWRELPIDVSEKICNKLIDVRRINGELKTDLKFGLLDFLCKRLDRLYCQEMTNVVVMDSLLEILGYKIRYAMFNDEDPIYSLIEVLWAHMDSDQMMEFYDMVDNMLNTPI